MAKLWEDEIKRKAQQGIKLSNPTKESQALYDKYRTMFSGNTTNHMTSQPKIPAPGKGYTPNFIKPSDWNETIRKAQVGIPLEKPTGEKYEVYNNYQNMMNTKAPTVNPYQSQYKGKIDNVLDQILNAKFSYDVESDPLYQQYKTTYNREGERALEDAMGQSAALTGGRQNSWSMTAGQQAQNYYSTQLNDKVPELYQAAYDRYLGDLSKKQGDIGIMSNLDAADYGKYMDKMNYDRTAFENDRNFYRGNYERDRDFNYSAFMDDRNFTYQKGRDNVSDEQWAKTFNRGIFENDRSFNRGVLESDRNYNRGVLESDRNYGLSREKFTYDKEQDKLSKQAQKEQEDVLGALYQGMQEAPDPNKWLIQYAPRLSADELDYLYKKLPKPVTQEDLYYQAMIDQMRKQ